MQVGRHAFELMKEFEHEPAGLGGKMDHSDDGRSGRKRLHHVTLTIKAINNDARWEVVFRKEGAWPSKPIQLVSAISINLRLIMDSWMFFDE